METIELFQRLGLALAIGLLIGVERGWHEREGPPGSRTAGIRTFALMPLLGAVWAALIPYAGPLPLALGALGFSVVFAAYRWRENVAENDFSVTSVVVAMLAVALGAMAVLGSMAAAAAAGVATTALLAGRHRLHGFVRQLTWPELRSAVVLLAMTVLLLPILPNRALDPLGLFNPFELWLMIVLIAAISFAGYVAMRTIGQRKGLAAAAAAGALVSSTAVTLNNARLAARNEADKGALAGAIGLAWMVSITRVTVVATIINRTLILALGPPMFAALLVLAVATAYLFRRDGNKASGKGPVLKNPFDFGSVLGLGLLLAGVLAAAKLLSERYGSAGLLPFAAASGLVDVDPITLSAARLGGNSVSYATAALAILIAVGANLVTKMVTAVGVGGVRFGAPLVIAGVLAAIAAGLVWMMFGEINV
jgi:uncharacterized membrane protein (DUF4010 family)